MLDLRFGSLLRAASLVLCGWLVAMPALVPAQVLVKPEPAVTATRALYFAADDSLLHIEILRDVAGRPIQTLPPGYVLPSTLPQSAPATTPPGASAMLTSSSASYVVYVGPDPGVVNPQGQQNVKAVPLAFERLGPNSANRPIQCAPAGTQNVCRYPMMCHCGMIGSCCCY